MVGSSPALDGPVAIVRDLAETEPIAAEEVGGMPYCVLCGGEWASLSARRVTHEASCPWRRARDWAAEHVRTS